VSVSIYQSHLEAAPTQYTLLKMLRPPVYEIELSNNQLIGVCYYKDGSSKRYQVNATFSNRRMVIADFLSAVEAMAALLLKFPKHPFGTNGFAVANVTQELADGLTAIEVKAITEAIWAASRQAKRTVISTEVSYQGQVISQ
jgi:hypothetical protein